VNAIGDTTLAAWDAIAAVQADSQPFDGLVTEIEFWNGGSFTEFVDTLEYVRSLDMQAPSGGPIALGVYIGWPEAEQVNAILPLVDRLYVHVYVTAAELAFGYGQERFGLVAAGNAELGTSVEVRPIFSAEGTAWAAGPEHFMGDWLTTHTLDEAELELLAGWQAAAGGTVPPITGFQYYDYFFLERHLP
jgi:hypothetical protein